MSSFSSCNWWWRHPGKGGGAGSVQHWSFNSSHNIRHLAVLPDPLVHELVLLPPGVWQLSIRHLAILPHPVRHPASLAPYLRHLATPPSLLTWLAVDLARILKVSILNIMFFHRLLVLLVRMLKLLTWCLLIILLTERMMLLMTLVLFLAILLLLNMLLIWNMLLAIMLVLMFLTILLLSQLDLLAWIPNLLLSSSCGELLYALSDILNTVSCSSLLGLSYYLLWGVVWKPLLLLVVPVPLSTWVQGHLWGGGSFLWQLLSSCNSWLNLLLLLLNSLVLIVLRYLVVVKVVLVVVVILIRNIVKVVILPPRTIVLILFQPSCSIHFICWWLFHHRLGCCSILILVWVKEWNCLSRLLLFRLLCLLSTPTWLLLLLVIIPGLLLLVIIPRLLLDWLLLLRLLLERYLRLQLVCSSGPVTIHQYRQSEILDTFHFISFDGFS